MRKRDELPAPQLNQSSLDQAPLSPARAAARDFEAVSWLALVGALAAAYLTIAFPNFDPLAALFSQFP
jgi:hypothetical protein